MSARWIEKLGQTNFDIKRKAGKKIPNPECLSRINTEDDERTAFVDAIEIDLEQDNTDYGSQGWQLDKLQRVKLRDSQQNDKLLKGVYSWQLNREQPESRKMKNGASKELWKYWVQYTNLGLIDAILYRIQQKEPKHETVY